jgi:membrane protein
MKRKITKIWKFIEKVINQWIDDKCPKLGAALSFYTIFSLSPLLLVAVFIAGALFGEDAASGEIVEQIEELVGKEGAVIVQTALVNTRYSADGLQAIIISAITLLIGSTVVFIELQDSLNMIWKVKPKPGRRFFQVVKGILVDRFQSFAMVVGIGFLLLVSLLISALLAALNRYLSDTFLNLPLYFFDITNIIISLLVIFVLFMMIFKILPDINIKWKDVWVGALVTAVLFVLGKFLIGLYLGSSTLGSTYGAAGSLVIFLLWVYYSAQILFLGAEFTRVYVDEFGRGIELSEQYITYKKPAPSDADKNEDK